MLKRKLLLIIIGLLFYHSAFFVTGAPRADHKNIRKIYRPVNVERLRLPERIRPHLNGDLFRNIDRINFHSKTIDELGPSDFQKRIDIQNKIFPLSDAEKSQYQMYLNFLGYYHGNSGDPWDGEVIKAIMRFQAANELMADGIIGPLTRPKLEECYSVEKEQRGQISIPSHAVA